MVDLEQFLLVRGEKLLPSGREKRLGSNHSITIRGNTWYDHATGWGGKAISFVQYHFGLSYPEAVTLLLGSGVAPWVAPPEEEPQPFSPPIAHENMRRVFAYLIQERKFSKTLSRHSPGGSSSMKMRSITMWYLPVWTNPV